VVDAADPACRNQYRVTRRVLAEIDADDRPRLLIFNKSDLLDDSERAALASEFPDAILMSARSAEDVSHLHGLIQTFFEQDMEEAEFVIPYDQQAKVSLLHDRCRVLEERYDEDGAHIRVRASVSLLDGLRREL
jgi:GTP-binding protein HflX